MKAICPKCLDDGNKVGIGNTEDGRTFTIYSCPTCGCVTNVFDVPQFEHETVLIALVHDALSDKPGFPKREEFVEQQLRLFNDEPRVWY